MGFRNFFFPAHSNSSIDERYVGEHICTETLTERTEKIIAEIYEMLWHPPGIRPYPLTNFWWNIEETQMDPPAHVIGVLQFVEGMRNDFWGNRTPDSRSMTMRWDVVPVSADGTVKAVKVRWTDASNSQYLTQITSRMALLTDQTISLITGSGIVPTAPANGRPSRVTPMGSRASTNSSPPPLTGGLQGTFSRAWKQTADHSTTKIQGKTTSKSASRTWPTPQDYQEAVQNPQIAFQDRELAGSEPELTPLGMPKVASGAFASVYRMKCRGRDIALRCFLRSIENQAYRYKQLSKFILADDLTYTIGFEFQFDGIRIHADKFPVLKMEWIEGTQFDIYIEQILPHSEKLKALQNRFRKMTAELYQAGIAHGDLQHGNILVKEDELYLVDYDGMFVPSLAGEQSNELGHGNYQHPGRNSKHFGPYLDNFSAWVIDTSLFALTVDSSLWAATRAGDECLLFRRKDFLDPLGSPVFNLLLQHPCQELRQRTQFLRQLTDRPLDQIPWLGADGNPVYHAAVFTVKDIENSLKSSNSKTARETRAAFGPGGGDGLEQSYDPYRGDSTPGQPDSDPARGDATPPPPNRADQRQTEAEGIKETRSNLPDWMIEDSSS